ncbi:hypothetical protein ANO11243_083670 [Dothideomycetidae sp. 11243]|nr:hypothetical protein ANO11243_083670 [fungal sp. No.11243]
MPISSAGTKADASAFITNATSPYFQYPFSSSSLPPLVHRGLIGPATMGIASVIATTVLLVFLASRFLTWKKHYKRYLGYNQYLVLFINLLVADLIQALSFVISLYWRHINAILAPSIPCTVQGWLLNLGDVASGFFVLLIAASTFYSIVKGDRVGHKTFLATIFGTWIFSMLLTVLGPILHGRTFYVRAGAWCWASALYETERLALHYFWIFFVQFFTLGLYLAILVNVKLTMRSTSAVGMANPSRTAARAKIDKATRSMILYPIAYIFLTLPLSSGRMWSLAHAGAFLPDSYILTAGTMIASSGFIDACLYAVTRASLMQSGSTTDPTSTLSFKDRISRPALMRAFSSRSFRPGSGSDGAKAGADGVGRSVSVGNPPDPYSLGTFNSTARRSSSVPALRQEKCKPPVDYGFGYSSQEHFVARSASGCGLGLSIDGGDDDNYRRRELALEECGEEAEEETPHNNKDVMAEKF